MTELTVTQLIELVGELKTELRNQYTLLDETAGKALPVPSIQLYADGSIRLKRSDTEYMCPTIRPPYTDQKIKDTFDMVLSRGRKIVVDDDVQLGESLVLGVNCRYVDK